MSDAGWRHPGLWLASLVVAVSAEFSRALAFTDGGLSLFWPIAGLGLVMAHRWGWRGVLALWLGLLAWAALAYPHVWWAAPLIAMAGSIGPVVIWRLTRQLPIRYPQPFQRLPAVLRIMSAQLLIGSPLAACIGTGLYVWLDPSVATSGLPPPSTLLMYVVVYWIIESCGALLVTPLAWDMLLGQPHTPPRDRLRHLQMAFQGHVGITTATLGFSAVLAAAFAVSDAANARAFSYLILPMLVVAAQRCNARAAHVLLATTGLLITALSAFAIQHLRSADTEALVELLLLVLFMLVSAGVVQMLVALNAERRAALEKLEAQAFTDPLTGLANEAGLYRAYEQQSATPAYTPGLVMMQLGNWQAIEQLDGPKALMDAEQLAARLVARETPGWLWARTGSGDLIGLTHASEVTTAQLEPLLAALGSPVDTGAAVVSTISPLWRACGVTVGTASTPPAMNVMLARLREAALQASETSSVPILRVAPDDNERIRAHAQAIESVRQALNEGRLAIWAQPIGQMPTEGAAPQAPRKCEALVRLLDEKGQLLSPALFMPAAMQGGLMQQLDREVIDRTLAWFAARPEVLAHIDYCSLNLSAPSLGNPGLADWIASRLRHHAVPPERFTFEITENQAIAQPRQAAQTITELRALGCRVAIDDFGTGNATFDYLKRFRVDIVKIDGSFIKELHLQPLDRAIVRSMVDIARLLHVQTVAEHVDHPDILHWTQTLGVDDIQGYWLGRPQPLDELFRPVLQSPTAA